MKDTSPQERNPFRSVTTEEINSIGSSFFLRRIDRLEAQAMCGMDPYAALRLSLRSSKKAYAIYSPDTDELIGFMGVTEHSKDSCSPWLVGSPRLKKYRKAFIKWSRTGMEDLLDGYERAWNFVAAENLQSIRWLEWLGFTVDPRPVFLKHPLVPFHFFYRER